jgi:hypothetical protein
MDRLSLCAGTALLAIAWPAYAQDLGLPDRPIRRAEVIEVVRQQFAKLDSNRDGVVDRAEFDAFRAKQEAARGRGDAGADQGFAHIGGKWFERSDQNGDGKVTLTEAEARPLQLFDMADIDHDGIVSVQERRMALLFSGK